MRRRILLGKPIDKSFVFTVKTDNAGTSGTDQFTIPTTGSGYDFVVQWGDGSSNSYTGTPGAITHTYPSSGTYQVKIKGVFPRIFFNNGGDRLKLTSIVQWGDVLFSNTQTGAFFGCANLTSIPDGGLWFNTITTALSMFRGTGLTSLPADMLLTNLVTAGDGAQNGMFRDCSLASLPSGMTLNSLSNGSSMFRACTFSSLPSSMSMNSITIASNMFLNCTNLASLPSVMALNTLTTAAGMFQNNVLTSLPAGMELPLLSNGVSMFSGNTINTTRYSQLLVDLESGNANNTVTFHGGGSKYNTAGQTARNALIARGWTITDGGLE